MIPRRNYYKRTARSSSAVRCRSEWAVKIDRGSSYRESAVATHHEGHRRGAYSFADFLDPIAACFELFSSLDVG